MLVVMKFHFVVSEWVLALPYLRDAADRRAVPRLLMDLHLELSSEGDQG